MTDNISDWALFCQTVDKIAVKEKVRQPLQKSTFSKRLTHKPYTFLSEPVEDYFSTTLDLHLLTFEQAYDVLGAFLRNAHLEGLKKVWVITGKGKEGDASLKNKVPRWLKYGPLSVFVARFEHAPPSKGGEGALEVSLIKRKLSR